MAGIRSCAHLGFLFLITSLWMHLSSAQNQEDQHRPSTISDTGASKPGWTWTLPPLPPLPEVPKPENHKSHHSGGRGGGGGGGGGGRVSECNCNCNCDCPQTECKSKENDRGGGPVVCLPMTCDAKNGCHLGGGMNVEAANTFQIPHFTVAGISQNGQSKSPAKMDATDAWHH